MKIAILTSGILPVPAVQGGAVENLIDYCLEYNERHSLHEIMLLSLESVNGYLNSSILTITITTIL